MQLFQPSVQSIFLKTIKGRIELVQFIPLDDFEFEIGLEVFVQINERGKGIERFDVTVCTPSWISNNLKNGDCVIGHGMLIVQKYSYDLIISSIERHVKMCKGRTVDDVMRRIGLLGEWESEWEI